MDRELGDVFVTFWLIQALCWAVRLGLQSCSISGEMVGRPNRVIKVT